MARLIKMEYSTPVTESVEVCVERNVCSGANGTKDYNYGSLDEDD